MKLWIWFEHEKGPYHIEDEFNSFAEAEDSWRDDPYFISAEPVGTEPPVAKEYRDTVAFMYGLPTA